MEERRGATNNVFRCKVHSGTNKAAVIENVSKLLLVSFSNHDQRQTDASRVLLLEVPLCQK